MAEIVLLVIAAYTKLGQGCTKCLAWTLLIAMIVGLGWFLHASISDNTSSTTGYVEALKQQRQDAVASKVKFEQERSDTDPDWISRRTKLQVRIDDERKLISDLDQKIADSRSVSTGSLSAMIVNALLSHSLVGFFGKRR